MASINKPPILDETGQAILNELERLTAIAGPPGEDYVLTSADKAEIAGMVDVSGKVDEPATEGTSGQVLTTDGQGGRSWQTVQGGGGGSGYPKLVYEWKRGEMYNVYTPLEIDHANGRVRFDTTDGLPTASFPGKFSGLWGYIVYPEGNITANTVADILNKPPKVVDGDTEGWVEFQDTTTLASTLAIGHWALYYKKASPPADTVTGSNTSFDMTHWYRVYQESRATGSQGNAFSINLFYESGTTDVNYAAGYDNALYTPATNANNTYAVLSTRGVANAQAQSWQRVVYDIIPHGEYILVRMTAEYTGAQALTTKVQGQRVEAWTRVKNLGISKIDATWGNYPAQFNGSYWRIYDMGVVSDDE